MSLQKYKNHYLDIIHKYTSQKKYNKLFPEHKIYEILYALELDLISWDDLPPDFSDKFYVPHKLDYGVDLVDLNYTTTCQVKKYENTRITWSDLCNFRTYSSDVLNINNGNLILATTNSAKIDKLGNMKLIESGIIKLIRNDFQNLLNKYSNIKPNKNKQKVTKTLELRPYLLECYDVIINNNTGNIIKCQLPCGCGKTFIILYTILQELKINKYSKFILFIPWLDLATQTYALYNRFNLKCVFIGDGNNTIPNNNYNIIICINPSVIHIDTELTFRYKFIDEAHHLENDESILKKK